MHEQCLCAWLCPAALTSPALHGDEQVAYRPDSGMSARSNSCYCLTKAMLNRAAQLLADDPVLTQKRISINAVDPGWCRQVIPFLTCHRELGVRCVHDLLAFPR